MLRFPAPFALLYYAQKSVALKAKGSAFTGKTVRMASVAAPRAVASGRVTLTVSAKEAEVPERLRLHNLSPLQGSRKKKQRLGRGYGGKGVSAPLSPLLPTQVRHESLMDSRVEAPEWSGITRPSKTGIPHSERARAAVPRWHIPCTIPCTFPTTPSPHHSSRQ